MSRLFVILHVCIFSLGASVAFAGKSSSLDWARQRVQKELLQPLAKRQSSRFSRGRPPPTERRVRVLSSAPITDAAGHGFVPFAVDIRYGSEWREDIAGCVYDGTGPIFVKSGEEYRPAAFLLGKKTEPAPGVCKAAPPRS